MDDTVAPELASHEQAAVPGAAPRRRRRRWPWVLAALLVLLLALPVTYVASFAVNATGGVDRSIRSTGHDAYWLGHAWVDGRKVQADVDALAAQLEGSGIRDLYIHAGPYADDGTLDPALRPKATWLLEALHTAAPEVRVQAWLGNVLADDRMRLTSGVTQTKVLEGVDDILAEGWDGVHYDFEPALNNDQPFLDLLKATHAKTQAAEAQFSVATPKLHPVQWFRLPVDWLPMQALWSQDYLRQVSEHVDQVAIMSYDTFLPSEKAYQGYIRRQTELALDAVPADVDLLIGAPAYHDQKIYRWDSAETMAANIAGVQQGLEGVPRDRPIGVSLYVDFDATDQDWASYRDDWAQQ
ncbi:glycoside hydrolase family 18 protein [Kineosporia babensis]|uniref:GH18 domain-containing protein n=1 Tax=Kineosporia babensis TaxID=499548 RepID=A0A9X1SXG9_9ACTN|nr:hypothetical protein [Kineosporia babensis]MCD5316212.1 hypothetical protein [Kineosporia babensis]